MNTITLSFLLTITAGLSTLLGTILILIPIKENKIIPISLAFASGVMLTISITDLIPESLILLNHSLTKKQTFAISILFILIGIILSLIINNKIQKKEKNTPLYKIGIISMIAIILHNIPEGIITFISTNKNISLGISLTIAIALHNIPEGISISIPIYYATKNKTKAILYTLVAALSEPLGALITYLFLLPLINNQILGILYSIIAGIMLQISITELLPESYNYKNTKLTILSFMIGILFMLLKYII